MTLADLTTYAAEKYNITEEHKWNDFPGFSVLCHPVSKKWLALLIRKQDSETGTTIENATFGAAGYSSNVKNTIFSPNQPAKRATIGSASISTNIPTARLYWLSLTLHTKI